MLRWSGRELVPRTAHEVARDWLPEPAAGPGPRHDWDAGRCEGGGKRPGRLGRPISLLPMSRQTLQVILFLDCGHPGPSPSTSSSALRQRMQPRPLSSALGRPRRWRPRPSSSALRHPRPSLLRASRCRASSWRSPPRRASRSRRARERHGGSTLRGADRRDVLDLGVRRSNRNMSEATVAMGPIVHMHTQLSLHTSTYMTSMASMPPMTHMACMPSIASMIVMRHQCYVGWWLLPRLGLFKLPGHDSCH